MLKHVVLAVVAVASARPAASPEDVSAQVIALERGALDRWGRGDPGGYIEVYDPQVTYFDPFQEKRVDGLDAVKAMLAPITGKVRVSRYDMLDPKVQPHGDVAVLSFNLLSYQKQPDGTEPVVARWNATAVYLRTGRTWKSIHVHWSFLKPELKARATEGSRRSTRSSAAIVIGWGGTGVAEGCDQASTRAPIRAARRSGATPLRGRPEPSWIRAARAYRP
jgi:hypothetical protein